MTGALPVRSARGRRRAGCVARACTCGPASSGLAAKLLRLNFPPGCSDVARPASAVRGTEASRVSPLLLTASRPEPPCPRGSPSGLGLWAPPPWPPEAPAQAPASPLGPARLGNRVHKASVVWGFPARLGLSRSAVRLPGFPATPAGCRSWWGWGPRLPRLCRPQTRGGPTAGSGLASVSGMERGVE